MVVSPELADVLAAIITRIRRPDGSVGCVTSYDSHERVWNPPMPLLFQRRFSLEQRSIPGGTIADWLGLALRDTGITDAAGRPLQFTPHDFRRMFITDAVLHGMPPHIAQLVAGHRDINTTMGYKAVYPEEVINGHRAFIARRRARCARPRIPGAHRAGVGTSSSVISSAANSPSVLAVVPTPPPASTNTPACDAPSCGPTRPNGTASSTSATTSSPASPKPVNKDGSVKSRDSNLIWWRVGQGLCAEM